jgi:hypothetical protein
MQSKDSFKNTTRDIAYGDVYDFINEANPRGCVYFINWVKINSKSNVVLREGEYKNLMSKVQYWHNSRLYQSIV